MRILWTSLKFLIVMSILTGILYPLIITGIGKAMFDSKAKGSLIIENGKVVGSELIAQSFSKPEYFRPRPSINNFETMPSSASNLGPTSKTLEENVTSRRGNSENDNEMLFTSASGLDPHISPDSAIRQLPRILKARQLSEDQLENLNQLVYKFTEDRTFGIFGERRVNVLMLNIALDKFAGKN